MNLTLTQHDISELKQWLSKDLYNSRNDCTSFDQTIELRSKPGQIICSLPLIRIILPNTTAQVAKPIYGSASRHKYSIISCTYDAYMPHNPRWETWKWTKQESADIFVSTVRSGNKSTDISVLWYASVQFSLWLVVDYIHDLLSWLTFVTFTVITPFIDVTPDMETTIILNKLPKRTEIPEIRPIILLPIRFYKRLILTIIHRSGGKYPPLSPTLRWIIVLVYATQAEKLADQRE